MTASDSPATPHVTPRLAVVVGSSRPGRRGEMVADWVRAGAARHLGDRADLETVDLRDVGLPFLDEALPAAMGDYEHDHTRAWAERVASFDGFVFVVPEYNHSFPAVLKNAMDFLFAEWNHKAAGFVSYGIDGGVRAVEQLRLVLAELAVATVRPSVSLGLFADFDLPDMSEPGTLTPAEHREDVLRRMLEDLLDWATALRDVRARRAVVDA